jgi:predicted permease
MTLDIILAIAEIFGLFAVGCFARYKGYIREEEIERWSRFVLDIFFPFFVFNSIIRNFEADRLGDLWPLPIIGLGIIILGAGCGYWLRRGLKTGDPSIAKTFHHFCAINNYGFLPIIIVFNLWGDTALARLFFLNLGSTLGYWTIGVALLGGSEWRKALRNMLNPCLVALVLAILISICRLNRFVPEIVLTVSATVGAAAIPCMLTLIGASLYPFPALRNKRDLTYLTLVRLVLLPLILIFFLKIIPLDEDVINIALIVALMPTAVSSTILTRRFGGDPDFAAHAAVITTLASVVTVPLGLWMLQS